MKRHDTGMSLIELLAAVAIAGIIAIISIGAFANYRRHNAVRGAAAELRSIFHAARMRAITCRRNTALKFTRSSSQWRYALYEDTNGNGVRNDDIAGGIDRPLAPPAPVARLSPDLATIGLPATTIVDPDGDRLPPDSPPVQFNRSTLCSFSPEGASTPGTIYLTDRAGELYAVRVYGATAKIRVLRYDASSRKWESR